ncbi:MAG: DUF357 domain-containing protein [Nanoarchaeota archaeon]
MINQITPEKLKHSFEITEKALATVEIALPAKTHLEKTAIDFLEMATNYIEDAKHFEKKGDFVNAFGALYYAHAWLDAGARLGLFDVKHDSDLFTVD